MSKISAQYEAFPYPERNPADEKKRLIRGSPSNPLEIDHFLFNGQRDWSVPFRVLVAGGGTGDGLIQLATMLASAGRPYEITYVDLSQASRKIAEKRAKIRGLNGITFVSGDLMQAPDLGQFDYIDCCGVLHHLPDPTAGFNALAAALAPTGGLGFMVYAPYGRSGVYPLQEAFAALYGDLPPRKKLKAARAAFKNLPDGHPFRRNPHLVDHHESDAGFYDLLLHSQDQAFDVARLLATLGDAGLELTSFTEPARYDISRFTGALPDIDPVAAMVAAEKLDGTMKTHVAYATLAGRGIRPADGRKPTLVPHFKGFSADQLARVVAQGKALTIQSGGTSIKLTLPKAAAPALGLVNGRRSLGEIAQACKFDPIGFASVWGSAANSLSNWGLLWYSGLGLGVGVTAAGR